MNSYKSATFGESGITVSAYADNKSASYTLSMGYDNMHRITSKRQHLTQTGVQFEGTLNAGYDLTYTYRKGDGRKFQLDNVRDINYRTEETPTDSTTINNGHKYEYDLNGNLVYINTSRVKKDGKEDEKVTEQKYRWDEENRLLAADENGFVSNYWYDADGERTVKTSGENEAIYVNSEFSGGNTGTARFSLYVSPYLVAGQGGKYTKHIYVGSQRIVSKLGDLASYGADPRRISYAGNEADGLTINYKDKYNQQLQSIKDNYKAFDLPYNGQDNDDYVNGQGFCCNDGTPEAAQARAMAMRTAKAKSIDGNFKPNDDYEKMQFYYHPDHFGSSSYITNLDGEVSQHIEYVPFGEVFIEERNNTWNTPYLFNAKEFDEETGMYYYGARYYEPRLSLWMSTDLMQEKHIGFSSYCYSLNNPVKYIDPDGLDVKPAGAAELKMIQNTLPKEARDYVRLDKNGFIDRTLVNSYSGISLNFSNLRTMVNSDRIVEVVLDDKFTFMGQNGKLGTATMQYIAFDPKYDLESSKDLKGETMNGLSTGESGFMGKTLFPDKDGIQNSPNGNIIVIINKNLSPEGAAEIYSHEANGHALLYIQNGGNHKGASHQPIEEQWIEGNETLKNMIVNSKKETIKNMQEE